LPGRSVRRVEGKRPDSKMKKLARLAEAAVLCAALSCTSSSSDLQAGAPAPSTPPISPQATAASSHAEAAYRESVSGERAMRYTREVVAFGSRPVGSPAHRKLEAYIRSQLRGITVEDDVFTASTPAGQLAMRNIIAKFPGTKDGIIVIGGHYDTNYPLKNFVGANDGGSSTGLLLELAAVLRQQRRNGYSVWLVWFDGEEA